MSKSAVENVLIVGGGIAGTTLAISLQRVGISAEIVELHDKVVGVGIVATNNTMRALHTLGLLDQCMEHGFSSEFFRAFDADGNLIQDNPMQGSLDGYPPCIALERPVLSKILRDTALNDGATLRIGVTIEDMVDGPDNVSVTFTDGTNGVYDLVVGADGAFSDTRRRLFGDKYEPKPVGQSVWRWQTKRHPEINTTSIFHGGSGKKIGIVPLSDETMYVLVTESMPSDLRIPQDQVARTFAEHLKAYSARLLAEICTDVTDSSDVVYRPFATTLVPAPWYVGRTLLIGDAVHATTAHLGNGGGMAIEDALVLTEVLDRHSDVKQALEEFMERRFERCRMVYDNSLQICHWEMEDSSKDFGYELSMQSWAELLEPI